MDTLQPIPKPTPEVLQRIHEMPAELQTRMLGIWQGILMRNSTSSSDSNPKPGSPKPSWLAHSGLKPKDQHRTLDTLAEDAAGAVAAAKGLLPTHVGVNRGPARAVAGAPAVPHARGGEPHQRCAWLVLQCTRDDSSRNPLAQGQGRTAIARALVASALAAGIRAQYHWEPTLLEKLHAAAIGEGLPELRRDLHQVPFLALDDLATKSYTDFRAEQIHELIEARYEAELPLVLTTRLSPGQLAEHFGDAHGPAILARVEAMCLRVPGVFGWVRLSGPNRHLPRRASAVPGPSREEGDAAAAALLADWQPGEVPEV